VFKTYTMGTTAALTVVTADSAGVADVAYESLSALHRVDSLMSNWTDQSEVARINREAGRRAVTVQPEVAEVIDFALRVGEESDGAFDITVEPLVRLWGFLGGEPHLPGPGEIEAALARTGLDKLQWDGATRALHFTRDDARIDLGGIAKGYAVDRAANILKGAGTGDALIDLSGNMVAIGNAKGREGWMVGIRDPNGNFPFAARLQIQNEAVATSGDYEQFVDVDGKRHGHILDPRTGYSARGLNSVTVIARNAMTADAWATALFVLGPDEAKRVASERDDITVVLIEPSAEGQSFIWVERELQPTFSLAYGVSAAFLVRYF
jgi:thiamine biosynthesis lipoprotein